MFLSVSAVAVTAANDTSFFASGATGTGYGSFVEGVFFYLTASVTYRTFLVSVSKAV